MQTALCRGSFVCLEDENLTFREVEELAKRHKRRTALRGASGICLFPADIALALYQQEAQAVAAGGGELGGGAEIPQGKGPRRRLLSGHCHRPGWRLTRANSST